MLKKLFVVEWRATARTLAFLDLGVLGICVLTALFMAVGACFPVLGSTLGFSLLTGAMMLFSGLGIVVMMVGNVFINVRSFYNLLGQRGYLLLTLPVTTNQHILAKLLYAIASTIVAVLFANLDAAVLAAGSGENMFASIFRSMGDFDFGDAGVTLYLVLLALLALAAGYLFFYLCVAVGGQWPQQRLLASIVSYFVLQFVMQVALIVLVIVLSIGLVSFSNSGYINDAMHWVITLGDGSAAAAGVMMLIVLIFAAWNAILWAVTRYLMTKKLNLA